jgi:Heavy metal associated domain 2
MSHYVHSLPGRLRVKAPAFKNQPEKGDAASALLGGFAGIHLVESNPVTGSLLIRYDENAIRPARILGALVGEGLIELVPAPRPRLKMAKPAKAAWRRIAENLSAALPDLIADLIVNKLAKRAAVALVSAVI